MKIVSVVGARPNFMKIAPFVRAVAAYNRRISEDEEADGSPPGSDIGPIEHLLVHTGQHYDDKMSRAFFEALDIPDADINLGIGSGTHAEQVGKTMIAFEKVLRQHRPDWVVVVGDVNATCACSITAKKEHVKLAHIEAGLRSFDMAMPEEINRLVTDRLADLLLTPCAISGENLRTEGVPPERIRFVGNIMIDTLDANRDKASRLAVDQILRDNALLPGRKLDPDLPPKTYALLTMHRPSNVDEREILGPIVDFLCDELTSQMPLVWTLHPRTRKQLEHFGLWAKVCQAENLWLLHPLGYHAMLRLNMDAAVMLTDSGGLQEECCVLGTPCLTMRWNTERPITLKEHGGVSILVGNEVQRMRAALVETKDAERAAVRPQFWDGHTAERIVEAMVA